MPRKMATKQLRKALSNDLVQLRRSLKRADRLEGYLVAVGTRWVVLAAAAAGEPNGWSVVRRTDLRSVWEGKGERFMRRVSSSKTPGRQPHPQRRWRWMAPSRS